MKEFKDKLELVPLLSKGFGMAPQLVFRDQNLSPTAKAIYGYISSFAGKGTTAFPSVDLLCKEIGLTKNTFQKHKKLLEKEGYLITEQEKKADGQFKRNVYHLVQEIEITGNQKTVNGETVDQNLVNGENTMVEPIPTVNQITVNRQLTSITKDLKDLKELKDSKDSGSSIFDQQNKKLLEGIEVKKNNPETENELIDQFILENKIDKHYGSLIVKNFKKYSTDFDTFKVFYDKLYFAHRSVEKEKEFEFEIDLAFTSKVNYFHKELSKSFWKCIQQYRSGKVRNSLNGYLFICFKDVFEFIAEDMILERIIEREESDQSKDVPMHNWINDEK